MVLYKTITKRVRVHRLEVALGWLVVSAVTSKEMGGTRGFSRKGNLEDSKVV